MGHCDVKGVLRLKSTSSLYLEYTNHHLLPDDLRPHRRLPGGLDPLRGPLPLDHLRQPPHRPPFPHPHPSPVRKGLHGLQPRHLLPLEPEAQGRHSGNSVLLQRVGHGGHRAPGFAGEDPRQHGALISLLLEWGAVPGVFFQSWCYNPILLSAFKKICCLDLSFLL